MAIDLLGATRLYCGVTTINQIRFFQDASDKFVSIDFSYNGGNATFEVCVKGGVNDKVKPAFLLEVKVVLDSMFTAANNFRGYVKIEDIETEINSINL